MFRQQLRTAATASARQHRLRLVAGVGVASAYYFTTAEKELQPQTTLLIEFDKIKLTERKLSPTDQLDDTAIETRELIEALEAAAADDKIGGMISTTGSGSNIDKYSATDVEEIRRAVQSFGKANKNATIIQENIPSLQACYFGSAFTVSVLHPRGTLSLSGPSTTMFFASSMLKKHGVKVDVFRHGQYKSAPSFFSSTGSTRSERANLASVQNCTLCTLWRGILSANPQLNATSGTNTTQLTQQMDNLPSFFRRVPELSCIQTGAFGFVQILGELSVSTDVMKQCKNVITLPNYLKHRKNAKARDELWKLLARFSSTFVVATSHQASFHAYGGDSQDLLVAFDPSFDFMRHLYTSLLQQTPKIPVVCVSGEIGPQCAKNVVASLRQIQSEIEMGADIKNVLLRISSPGGDTTSSRLISDQLEALSVPVTVSFGNVAASGGYWVAAKADRIFANETTRTGSIGVYLLRFDLSKTCKQSGVNVEHISTGPFADLDNLFHPITHAMKKALSYKSAEIYDEFKERVAQGRNISIDHVEALAQGRVYTGKQAKANGLVDDIGGLKETLDYVRHEHGMQDAVVEVYPKPQPFGFSDVLMHMFLGDTARSSIYGTLGQVDALLHCICGKTRAGQISDTTMLVADEETAVAVALQQLGSEESK